MRLVIAVSFLAALFAPNCGHTQQVATFGDLPLRINRDDLVRVTDRSGARVTGRAVSFGREGLGVRTEAGERRFTAEAVRRVDRSETSAGRGMLIGAGTMLVVGLAGCPKDSATGCPIFAALLWGAPMGALVGAWVPSMHKVFVTSSTDSRAAAEGRAKISLLHDLGMEVNLGDRLIVDGASGRTQTGELTQMDDSSFVISDASDANLRFAREEVARVSVSRGHGKVGALLGFAAFSALCLPEAGADWPDALVLCGGPGAAIGALIGIRIHTTRVVYPAQAPRLSLAPALVNHRVGLRASYRF